MDIVDGEDKTSENIDPSAMQVSQFPTSSAFDTETVGKSADAPATPFTPQGDYFKNKRLVLQSKMVLESAWLLF